MGQGLLTTALAAAWAALALLNYPRFHRFSPDDLLRVTLYPLLTVTPAGLVATVPAALAAFAMIVLTALAALATGFAAVDLLGIRAATRVEKLFFPLLLGFGSLGLLVAGAGMCGLFSVGSYAVILTPCAVLGIARIRMLFAGRVPALPFPAVNPGLLPALGLAVAVMAGALASGFAPAHMSDELVCHLGLARWYLEHHKIVPQPGNLYSGWPQLATMLYGAPLATGLVFGVKWTHWLSGLLAAYGVFSLARTACPDARTAAVLAFTTMPVAWTFAGRGFTEMFICALATGALLAASRANGEKNGTSFAVLAGACVGLAGGYKLTGLLTGLLILPLLPLRLVPAAVGAGLLASAPWLAKSALETGNPVFPLLPGLLGGLGLDSRLVTRFRRELFGGEPTTGQLLARLPGLPWSIPVHNLGSGPDGTTGIMILLALPLLIHATAREAIALVLFVLASGMGSAGSRFLLPAIPLILAVAARAIPAIPGRKAGRRGFHATILLLVGYQAAQYFQAAWRTYDDPLPVVLGSEPVGRYLDRIRYPVLYYPPGYSAALAATNRHTPPGARVLFLGGYGGVFHLPRPGLFHPLEGRPLPASWAAETGSTGGIARRFRQAGITHVLVNRWRCESFYDYWRVWDWPSAGPPVRWKEFWDTRAVPIWTSGGEQDSRFALYAITDHVVRQPHVTTPGLESEIIRLAQLLVRQKRLEPADAILSQARGLFDTNSLRWLAESEYRLGRGEPAEAEACCNRIAALAPESVTLLRCRAGLLASRDRLAEAAGLLQQAARREPDEPQIWVNLAAIYYALNDPGAAALAERELRRAEGERPDR